MITEQAMADPIARSIAAGEIAGAAALAWQKEGGVRTVALGRCDLESDAPVERDTIFRIASLTKPVTCMAALTLLDEGCFELDAPITSVAPELAELRVLRDPEGPLSETDAAERPISFRDLLTQRAGMTYAEFHRGPIRLALADRLGMQIDNDVTPDEWIAQLATLPLIDQPGAAFHYGQSIDLLGFLIARLEGLSLGTPLQPRVFEPLGMRDTGFNV